MGRIYEGMFLLDNQRVREDWKQAKAIVTGTLEKHGCKVHTSRRWDERKLAYPIRTKRRATYLLTYYEAEPEQLPPMRRDFDLNEHVLRYMNISAEVVPEEEIELSNAENADDFTVPEPPADDAPDPEDALEERGDRDRRDRRDDRPREGEGAKPAEGEGAKPAEGEDAKPAEGEASAEAKPEEASEAKPAAGEGAAPEAAAAEATKDAEGAGTSQEG